MDADAGGAGDCAFGIRWVGFALMNIHERIYITQLVVLYCFQVGRG